MRRTHIKTHARAMRSKEWTTGKVTKQEQADFTTHRPTLRPIDELHDAGAVHGRLSNKDSRV